MNQTNQINTIVHLGAGRCSELDSYTALQPERIVLVEADPQLAEALKARVAGLAQAQVVCVAVAGSPGPTTYHRFNLPDAGGLHAASGLLELFPGLKTVEQLAVEAVSPASLLGPLELRAEQENHLVIDLPGEEFPVLKALQYARQLHLFSRLSLHCGREPLYEGSEPATGILAWLKEQGFDILSVDGRQDPDRPVWTLQRNTMQLRNQELEKRLEMLQEQLQQATGTSDEQARQVAELRAEAQRLARERDDHAKLAGELQAQIEQLTKDRDEKAHWLNENVKWNEALKTQTEQLEIERQQLQKQVLTLLEQAKLAEERQKMIEQQKAELLQARQTAELAVKLQMLRESDLRDLQQRYKTAFATQERQQELLVKLGERLSVASNYFHQVADCQVLPPAMAEKPGFNPTTERTASQTRLKSKVTSKSAPAAHLKSAGQTCGKE